jgi:hypothetical protein
MERCECHDCTQARWKSSFQGQLESSQIGGVIVVPLTSSGPTSFEGGTITYPQEGICTSH